MKKKMKIALIEDNHYHALLMERVILEKYPEYIISVFRTGKSFLKSTKDDKFDLITVDFNLPDIDGLELLALIQTEKPDVPVIIVTGAGTEQTAVEAMKMGAVDYVCKTGDFAATIPRVIGQAYQKHRLILKNRRLESKARETEKLEMITTLVSTLNHEINNPLMAVLGNVELLINSPEINDDEVYEKLEMIEKSARRIEQITRQMANLMTASVKQTPVGPMLKLEGKGASRWRRSIPAGMSR